MTVNRKNNTQAETSQQGTMKTMQQDFHGYVEGSDEKFRKMQEHIEKLLSGMSVLMKSQVPEEDDFIEELDTKDRNDQSHNSRGVFRDPVHAAKVIQEQALTGPKGNKEGTKVDISSLKHLKLNFPTLKEGGDAIEWLRDHGYQKRA